MDKERQEKARKSAEVIDIMAKFIEHELTMDFPPQQMKVILNVPLKQLKDEVETLEAYVNALK